MKKYYRFVLICFSLTMTFSVLKANFGLSTSSEMMYSVSVSGAVNNPGVFKVPPSARVSTVLKLAEQEYQSTYKLKDTVSDKSDDIQLLTKKYQHYYPVENEDFQQETNGSLRNISLKRGDKTFSIDLLKFYLLGEEKCNPYIMDGDIIFVPAKSGTVTIFGAINREGEMELTPSDKLLDIIDLSLGVKPEAWLSQVEIVRFVNNNQTRQISVDLMQVFKNNQSSENIQLQDDDRIYVREIPDFRIKSHITIAGEVKFPGTYAIEEGKTTLLDIFDLCGEPTAKADLYNSFVQRQEGIEEVDPEFERLKTMNVSNMNSLEYAYFKNAIRELKGKYSVNLADLLSGDKTAKNILLRDEDFILIPQKSSAVNVMGQVVEPGLVSFVAGNTFAYYIEQAGGYDWNARKGKTRLIRAKTGKWIKPKSDTVIMEGDIIFVPEKAEFDAWLFTLDSLRIVSQIATLILVVQNLISK